MRTPPQKQVFEGEVEINPYGNWSDVDHGVYIGGENIGTDKSSFWWDYEGKTVRVTIEILPTEPE